MNKTHTHTHDVNQNLAHSIYKILYPFFLYFEGVHCETNIDDCQSNQCENNGTCVDGLEDYYCNCQAGFEGKEISLSNCRTLAVIKYDVLGSYTEDIAFSS